MRPDGLWLDRIGSCLPPVAAVDGATGRRTAARAGTTGAPEMALEAARQCLSAGSLGPDDIGVLLYAAVWHQGPEGWSPGAYLQGRLGAVDALPVEIRGGCTGFFTALDVAAGLLPGSDRPAALIVTADNFGTDRVRRDSMGEGQAVLGDAAVAVTVRRDGGFARVLSTSSLVAGHLEILHRGTAPLYPPAAATGEPMDFGARLDEARELLVRRGTWNKQLLEHRDNLVAVAEQAMGEAGVTRGDVDHLLLHSMPRPAAAALARAVGLPLELVPWEHADRIGHVGASDHQVAIDHLCRSGQLAPGAVLLLVGSSPGMTYKACVLQITDARMGAQP